MTDRWKFHVDGERLEITDGGEYLTIGDCYDCDGAVFRGQTEVDHLIAKLQRLRSRMMGPAQLAKRTRERKAKYAAAGPHSPLIPITCIPSTDRIPGYHTGILFEDTE